MGFHNQECIIHLSNWFVSSCKTRAVTLLKCPESVNFCCPVLWSQARMAASSPAANTRSLLNCTTLQAPKFSAKISSVLCKICVFSVLFLPKVLLWNSKQLHIVQNCCRMDITKAGQETIKWWPLNCDELYTVWVPWLVYLTNVNNCRMYVDDTNWHNNLSVKVWLWADQCISQVLCAKPAIRKWQMVFAR